MLLISMVKEEKATVLFDLCALTGSAQWFFPLPPPLHAATGQPEGSV